MHFQVFLEAQNGVSVVLAFSNSDLDLYDGSVLLKRNLDDCFKKCSLRKERKDSFERA